MYINNSPAFGTQESIASVTVTSLSYAWYDLGTFVTGTLLQKMTIADYSEGGIAVDQVAMSRTFPRDSFLQGIFVNAPIDARPARMVSDVEYVRDLYSVLLDRLPENNTVWLNEVARSDRESFLAASCGLRSFSTHRRIRVPTPSSGDCIGGFSGIKLRSNR